jgi:signal transduction histidine kinase/pSer/pThr/pTyr-binding forkhead associated (FHA) protein
VSGTPKLIIRSRTLGDRVVQLSGASLTIGRGADQDIAIPDRKISHAHAVLEWRDGRYYIRDLGSTNGTYVNGLLVPEWALEVEDEVLVGNTLLVFTDRDSLAPEHDREAARAASSALDANDRSRTDVPTPVPTTDDDDPGASTAGSAVEPGPQTVKFRLTDVQRDLLTNTAIEKTNVAQKRLQVLYSVADALREVTAVPSLLERVMDFIFEVVDADRGTLLLRDAHTEDFVPMVTRRRKGQQPDPPGVRATVSTGLIRQAIEAGEAIITRDAQDDDRFTGHQSIYLYGIRSAITVPLIHRERVLGVIHLDKRDARRPFDEEDVHVLVIISTQAAGAIANAELFTQIQAAKAEIERWNRELERKVEERTVEIQNQAERIAELAKQKDELLGMVAHDLRTPLTGLLGFAEIALQGIERDMEPARVKEDLEVIRATAVEMNDLLTDLLDVSKIESGKVTITPMLTDLYDLVTDSCRRYRLWAETKQIKFQTRLAEDIPNVRLDPRRIQQVLNNLVSNACKFSSGGDTITLSIVRNQGDLEFAVTDTGQGISNEDIARLFARFEQGSSRPTKGERGTGLGLAIAKKIVELHGGQIWVESKKGVGSRFVFTLPLR